MNVGFIGIGSMGAAMVPNLVRASHRVGVWNRTPAAVQGFKGVTVLPSLAAAFEQDAVLTMLSNDAAVRSVILDSGVLAGARKDCVHAMMATISLPLVEELRERHRAAGISYVAAPVFGVPAVAAKAELTILAAGDAAALATVQPLFDALGKKTWPLGDEPVHANVAKLAGNLMTTLAIEAMGEASALTESYGLKAGDFLSMMTHSIFGTPGYQRYGGNIARNSYEPGFKLSLGLKDIRLALAAAEDKGAALPAATIIRENMEAAVAQGMGEKDWSALAKVARLRAGLPEEVA